MENRKGNGIFLGIVSMATLIVAIIGATFAYFSASTESNEGAIGVTAYEFKLTLNVTPVYPGVDATETASLIPLNPTTVIENAPEPNNTNLLYALNEAKTKCIDDSGMQVCALYKVEIINKAGNSVELKGILRTTTNNASTEDGRVPFENLMYQAVTGSPTDNSLKLSGLPVPIKSAILGEIDIASVIVPAAKLDNQGNVTENGIGVTYVLVYLNDSGEDQSEEMGASYTGQLVYTSADGLGNTLTGTFKISPDTGEDETPGTNEEPNPGTENDDPVTDPEENETL